MHSEKLSVIIPAAKQQVFGYIANIDNFPRWATEFCQELHKEKDHYKVVSPMGELYFRIQANADSGEIDLFATPDIDGEEYLPTRVISQTGGTSEYVVDFCQPPSIGEAEFRRQRDSLRRELHNIKSYFESKQ
jgi:hypothetical protein